MGHVHDSQGRTRSRPPGLSHRPRCGLISARSTSLVRRTGEPCATHPATIRRTDRECCSSTKAGLRHEAPSNRVGCDARPRPPQRPGEAGGQHRRRSAASGGKRPSTIEQRSAASGPGAVARQKGVGKPIPLVEAPRLVTGPETGGYGLSGRSVLVLVRDRLARSFVAWAGEAAWRVAVARGDAPGVQLGAEPADRLMSERGKRPGGARRTFGFGAGAPSAVAAGAWRRTRSSRGSNDPPGRAGKPSTGRRGPVSTRHYRTGGGRR